MTASRYVGGMYDIGRDFICREMFFDSVLIGISPPQQWLRAAQLLIVTVRLLPLVTNLRHTYNI